MNGKLLLTSVLCALAFWTGAPTSQAGVHGLAFSAAAARGASGPARGQSKPVLKRQNAVSSLKRSAGFTTGRQHQRNATANNARRASNQSATTVSSTGTPPATWQSPASRRSSVSSVSSTTSNASVNSAGSTGPTPRQNQPQTRVTAAGGITLNLQASPAH